MPVATLPTEIAEAVDALMRHLGKQTEAACAGRLGQVLSYIERLLQERIEHENEIQNLRDEINRLKGEKPDPKRSSQTPRKPPTNHSSEQERKRRNTEEPPAKKRRPKLPRLQVAETRDVHMPREALPADAVSKGFEDKTVQNLKFEPHVIRFRREKFYSPSEQKTFLAPLPPGFDQGDMGPELVSFIHLLHWQMNTSQANILNMLEGMGFETSAGAISNVLTQKLDRFHAEYDAIHKAGLESTPWQQSDETTAKVNGEKQSMHVLCNPLYTFFRTLPDKSRQSVLDLLRNTRDPSQRLFRVNDEALWLLQTELKVKRAIVAVLCELPQDVDMFQELLVRRINEALGQKGHKPLGAEQLRRVLDATAIASYHAMENYPVVQLLVCDDAAQFDLLTREVALCWIHEGRHYKKLVPFLEPHRQKLEDFLKTYWDLYADLRAFQASPTQQKAQALVEDFVRIFSQRTGYEDLDARITHTEAKIGRLLSPFLCHPEIPLHNNASELGARKLVRKRDVSFGPRSAAGKRAWDTFLTLCETTRKLGVSFWDYLKDRFCRTNSIPRLETLIRQRAQELRGTACWDFLQ